MSRVIPASTRRPSTSRRATPGEGEGGGQEDLGLALLGAQETPLRHLSRGHVHPFCQPMAGRGGHDCQVYKHVYSSGDEVGTRGGRKSMTTAQLEYTEAELWPP